VVNFGLRAVADSGPYISTTAVLQDAVLPLSRMLRKTWSILSSPAIVLDQLLEESSGRKSAARCNGITVLVSKRALIISSYRLTLIVGASATDYLNSIAHREIEWITTHATSQAPIQRPWQFVSSVQNDPAAHTPLLQKYISAIPHITPQDPELLSPRLWHPDFHAGNIYIDSSHRISSIIDWQGAWTAPPFLGANLPSLVDYSIDMMMFLPEGFKSLEEEEKEKLRYQVAQSIMIHTYETSTRKKNPVMFKVMHLPHGSTLKQLEAFANSTWDNTLFPFEECLIRVERWVDPVKPSIYPHEQKLTVRNREWEAFDTNTTRPYHFSQEELQRHDVEVDSFNDSQEFWSRFDGVLTDEGFALNETYEQAVEAVKELKAAGLDGLEGEEREEFEKETHWITELDERSD
jgi:hypothetical protein